MPKTLSSTEAKSRFGEIVKWTTENQERIIVKHYGEPALVIMSYADYAEIEKMVTREKKRQVLDVLDALREEVRAQNPDLTAEEAYREAGFSERVIRETLHADAEDSAQHER